MTPLKGGGEGGFFFFPRNWGVFLHRVTAGKFLLLQHRTQVVQDFSIALLRGVPGGDADGGKSASLADAVKCSVLRCWMSFGNLPLPVGFQLLHHIGAKLGNQAEDVLGGEGFKTLPIHRMADRHIAGKAQQAFIHILRPQLRPHSTGRVRRKKPSSFSPASRKHVPAPAFLCTSPTIADLLQPTSRRMASQMETASSQGNPSAAARTDTAPAADRGERVFRYDFAPRSGRRSDFHEAVPFSTS